MQDNTESNYEIDFEVLILIKPDTDDTMYDSEFYDRRMVMRHFAWFHDASNQENFEEYVKVWYLNFEDVPFTIDGKKCKIPTKYFQSKTTGTPIPDIHDICQYLNKRGIYVKDMTQNDFQTYLADYFMFPLFEKEKIVQKEKLFEDIFKVESSLRLRNEGIIFEPIEFVEFASVRGINDDTTEQEFRGLVEDY